MAKSKNKSGEPFERYVADAYRALGYQVTRDTQVAGRQTDLLARQEVPGAPPIELVIECKDHKRPVGIRLVNDFITDVLAQCQAGEISGGALVSKSGVTPQARKAAQRHREITLLSLEELSSKIVSVRYPLQVLIGSYEKQDIFRDYLPLKVESLSWSSMIPSYLREDFDPLLTRLIRFDGERGTSAMLVLADFGAGKTTLLRNIEYRRAKAHIQGDDSRIPLFVQLRDYRDSQDVGTLLRASFRDAYHRDLPPALLWERINSGAFYLLLDGFDEMVDRSDMDRRLELFYALMPLLRSRSPVILTSRPSYLVERGELEALLKQLGVEEGSILSPVSGGAHKKVVAEHLRQKLFAQMRESGRNRGASQPISASGVEVVQLQPLDPRQIEEFIGSHEAQLAEVGATVSDLLAFIDRTYDLSDLATRPMLLRLIVETVVIGGLDLSDTSTHYGASGLYEVYTSAKLDLDLDKVRSRDGDLHRKARRQLAESIALEMYSAKSLELDFHETWERLAAEKGPLAQALARTSLSQGEIATDLAARSFLTVDQNGLCRFIHKSFRGFFIARILKEKLPETDSMFEDALEREVLYFLGGFDPTEPHVGGALWSAYQSAPKNSATLRRNLIVAFLYTRPSHDNRKIEDTEIFEAEFGRLEFNGTRMTDVTWRDATATRLDLVKPDWKGVHFQSTHFGKVLTERGEIDLSMRGSVIESWDGANMKGSVTGVDSTIEDWNLEDSSVKCSGAGFQVEQMDVRTTDMACKAPEHSEFSLAKMVMSDSRMRLSGEITIQFVEGTNSVFTYDSERDFTDWNLRGCVLFLSKGAAGQSAMTGISDLGFRCDRASVILAPSGISHSLLTSRGGVFGSLVAASGMRPIRFHPDVWGVLEAEDVLNRIGLPATESGCRLGRLLLVRRNWYSEEVEQPKRRRPVVSNLEALATSPDLDLVDPSTTKVFADLRRTARSQHDAFCKREWPAFEDYVDEDEGPLA